MAIHTEFGAVSSNMTDFLFWGFKKRLKKSKKWSKTTFFKNPKKCHFPPPKRSYIPSFRSTAQKVWPVEVGQTNRQTDTGRIQTFLAWPRYRIRSTYMGLLGETQRTGTEKGTRGDMGKPKVRAWGGVGVRAYGERQRLAYGSCPPNNYQITSWLNQVEEMLKHFTLITKCHVKMMLFGVQCT